MSVAAVITVGVLCLVAGFIAGVGAICLLIVGTRGEK